MKSAYDEYSDMETHSAERAVVRSRPNGLQAYTVLYATVTSGKALCDRRGQNGNNIGTPTCIGR